MDGPAKRPMPEPKKTSLTLVNKPIQAKPAAAASTGAKPTGVFPITR